MKKTRSDTSKIIIATKVGAMIGDAAGYAIGIATMQPIVCFRGVRYFIENGIELVKEIKNPTPEYVEVYN